MSEEQSGAASGKDKPDEVQLKDVVTPSYIVIPLVAVVVCILFGWYLVILKPALSGSDSLSIRLSKQPSANLPFSPELKPKTEDEEQSNVLETQSTDNDSKPLTVATHNEETSVVLKSTKKSRPTHSTRRVASTKPSKSIDASSEIISAAQLHDPPRVRSEAEETKNEERSKTVNVKADEEKEDEDDELVADKLKSFGAKLKESFLTPTTQTICTQAQISLNQCPN